MSALSFDDLRRANVVRCEESYHEIEAWSPTDWACALAGEVGEACNLVKKLRRLASSRQETVAVLQTTSARVLVDQIADELADVVIYADLLSARLGIDLTDAVRAKFNDTSLRIGSSVLLE